MLKRFVTGAVLALAASFDVAGAAGASQVNFNTAGLAATADDFDREGLNFFSDEGYFIPTSLSDPGDFFFPTEFTSTFWGNLQRRLARPRASTPARSSAWSAPGTFDLSRS